MRTVAFCEIDSYCRQVLAERWPQVDCYHDVTELDPAELAARRIDLICGGFPCQDISLAGSGAGLAGARSGLWRHFHRLIRDLRPGWVVIENVSALRNRGLGTVLADLATIGYDAEWHCIPATYVGAPHRRDRIWIVAHTNCGRFESVGIEEYTVEQRACGHESDGCGSRGSGEGATGPGRWSAEPDVGRMAHGVPARVDRLKALGNSIVPQIAEMIGRAIMQHARIA